jgi:hypothetical protein
LSRSKKGVPTFLVPPFGGSKKGVPSLLPTLFCQDAKRSGFFLWTTNVYCYYLSSIRISAKSLHLSCPVVVGSKRPSNLVKFKGVQPAQLAYPSLPKNEKRSNNFWNPYEWYSSSTMRQPNPFISFDSGSMDISNNHEPSVPPAVFKEG